MEPQKLTPWHYDEEAKGTPTFKDIVPGDMLNQQATQSAVNQAFGDSVSKEIKEDLQYRQDLNKAAQQLGSVESSQTFIASRDGVDQATLYSGALYLQSCFIGFFTQLRVLRKQRVKKYSFGFSVSYLL